MSKVEQKPNAFKFVNDENAIYQDIMSLMSKPDYDNTKQCIVTVESEFGKIVQIVDRTFAA